MDKLRGIHPSFSFIDEWTSKVPHRIDVDKKEKGKAAYLKRQANGAEKRAKRTRPSDISKPRITDGIPANHEHTRAHATSTWSRSIKKKKAPVALDLKQLSTLIESTTPEKEKRDA